MVCAMVRYARNACRLLYFFLRRRYAPGLYVELSRKAGQVQVR